jgi:hypothetical protein
MSEIVENKSENNIQAKETDNLIDKMTLELLMNKTQYNKYISKNDPKKHAEINEYLNNIKKYGRSISELTIELLNEPNKPITNEVNEVFEHYVKTLIRYFKMKEIESTNDYNDDQDDILFGNMDNNTNDNGDCDEYGNQDDDEDDEDDARSMKSYWGKDKVIRKKPTKMNGFGISMGIIPRIKK